MLLKIKFKTAVTIGAIACLLTIFSWNFNFGTGWISSPVQANIGSSSSATFGETYGTMAPMGANDPHLRLTPERRATAPELNRAEELQLAVAKAIKKYSKVSSAEAAGYWKFPPNSDDYSIVHYVNPGLSFWETWRLDPQQPGALLYERQADKSLKLLGVMFTAPGEATMEELNRRIPLSIARWHLHTNICTPVPIWDESQWKMTQNGLPRFGPTSPIATKAECDAVNGEFHPNIFGWMVHLNVNAKDPADVWNHHYQALIDR
ncbi:hypothetical protein IQ255_16050 [Pleurocapsales cyanobacterium LEGE 10410]|nr:hypothetical protein [Pleurocapsales cyanobacterium LEGE 10410]